MKLKDVGEFGFINLIAPFGRIREQGVVKGIGDDCAVIDVGADEYLLVTTDLLVEGIHFRMEWSSAAVLGAKALEVNFSDIAACGGAPREVFVSLAVPDRIELDTLTGLYEGMSDRARRCHVNLLGGDTTGSRSDLIINISVMGTVAKDRVLYRHTARAGDSIVVTGRLGASPAGLDILLGSTDLPESLRSPLVRAHTAPLAHLEEGTFLAGSGACTAAIDVSDGLSSDLGHLCEDSGLGAVIEEDRLPIADYVLEAAERLGKDPLEWVIHGGEVYVLLAGVRPDRIDEVKAEAERRGMALTEIGRFTEGSRMILRRTDGSEVDLAPEGWDHFRP